MIIPLFCASSIIYIFAETEKITRAFLKYEACLLVAIDLWQKKYYSCFWYLAML